MHTHASRAGCLLESDPRSRRHNLCSLLLDVHPSTRTANNAGSPPPPPPHLPHVPPLGLSGEALVPLGCRAECTGAAPRQRKEPKHNERQNPPSACLPAWPRDTLTGYANVPCRKKAVSETDRGARVASVLVQLVTTSSRRRPPRGERRLCVVYDAGVLPWADADHTTPEHFMSLLACCSQKHARLAHIRLYVLESFRPSNAPRPETA
ncbi:hypothetical protein HDK77DRAFT_266836 [Phyllosticta capitalensis]